MLDGRQSFVQLGDLNRNSAFEEFPNYGQHQSLDIISINILILSPFFIRLIRTVVNQKKWINTLPKQWYKVTINLLPHILSLGCQMIKTHWSRNQAFISEHGSIIIHFHLAFSEATERDRALFTLIWPSYEKRDWDIKLHIIGE